MSTQTMDKNSPIYKLLLRKELSKKFCQLNGMDIRTDLASNDRRELVRKSKYHKSSAPGSNDQSALQRLNQGHKLHAHKVVQEQLS